MDLIDLMIKKLEEVNEEQHSRIDKLEQEKLSLQRYIDELLLSNMHLTDELYNAEVKNEMLDETLDRACEMLGYAFEDIQYSISDGGFIICNNKPFKNNKEWKELLMRIVNESRKECK